ncbi:GLPK-like protein, partial [Mya arenaria]
WCEEDPLEILQSVHVCIEKAVDNLKALGIGLTNQRETIVVWDKTTGKPLYNTIQWLDLRAVPLVQGFIDKTPTKNLDAFRPITGLPIYTSSIIRFRWLVDNVPEVKRAVEEGRFYGIDKKVLPEITSSAEIYGNMNEGPLKGIPLAGVWDCSLPLCQHRRKDMFASKVNSTHGCYFAPFFSGLYFPDWENDARGIICGLSSFTRKEHICRAALESVCFQAKQMIDAVAVDAGVQLTSIKVDGGMVASDTLMQLQADISGCDVLRPVMQETTALGAAICAGIALGVWDVESTKQEIRDTFRSAVSSEEREVRFSRWHEAVRRCRHWVPAGSVI